MATLLFIPVIEQSSGATPNDIVYVGAAAGSVAPFVVGKRKIIRVISIGVVTATDYIALRFGLQGTMAAAVATDIIVPLNTPQFFDMGENDSLSVYSTSASIVSISVISKS